MAWQSPRVSGKPIGSLGQLLENVFARGDFFFPWGYNKGHFVNRAIYVKSLSEPKKTGLLLAGYITLDPSKAKV